MMKWVAYINKKVWGIIVAYAEKLKLLNIISW